jgi:HTH-type transcriptional regulator / antitoxin HigA
MTDLKYKVISSKAQYSSYCNQLENLVFADSKETQDEIELLTLLIEKWDADHNTFNESDPIRILHSLMESHHLKASDLVNILEVSKGYVSEILHYRKGLSKEVIRKLADRFKLTQEAFNRPYLLLTQVGVRRKSRKVKKSGKRKVIGPIAFSSNAAKKLEK